MLDRISLESMSASLKSLCNISGPLWHLTGAEVVTLLHWFPCSGVFRDPNSCRYAHTRRFENSRLLIHLYMYNHGKYFSLNTADYIALCEFSCRTLHSRWKVSSSVQWFQTLQQPGVESWHQETGSWLLMESVWLDWTTRGTENFSPKSHRSQVWKSNLPGFILYIILLPVSVSVKQLMQSSGDRLRLLVARADWMAKVIQAYGWQHFHISHSAILIKQRWCEFHCRSFIHLKTWTSTSLC